MALFVGMASLALPRPRDTSSLVIDPKLAAAPREKVEHVFGWHIFPRALLVYLIFVAASGAMIEWLAQTSRSSGVPCGDGCILLATAGTCLRLRRAVVPEG